MSNCERCGKELPETAAICPSCGTISSYSRPGMALPNEYGMNPPSGPGYTQGYGPQPQPLYPQQQPQQMYPPQHPNEYGMNPPSGPNYTQDYPPQQAYSQPQQMYAPQQPVYGQMQPGMYPPISVNINVMAGTPVVPVAQATNSTPVVVEVLLNIFLGIYGVGWLMAGETSTGVILLVCSILIYWPLIILGTILTLGIGLACLGPLVIGAIVMNAVLLNNRLKRKATYIIVPPMQMMPPQRMRPQ